MNKVHILSMLLFIYFSCWCFHAYAGNNQPAITYFSMRSQSTNAARDILGIEQLIDIPGENTIYGFIASTVEYNHSFNSNSIAQALFGDDIYYNKQNQPFITISGSTTPERGKKDWLADYFGLPRDFKSTIVFNPNIQNTIADISFYLGINKPKISNAYIKLDIPLVHTKWNLNFYETPSDYGKENSLPGAFMASACKSELSRGLLFPNATAFFTGEKIEGIHTLEASKWLDKSMLHRSNKIAASINAEFGWSFLGSDDYHCGAKIRLCAPTGDRPTGEFLFEQIIGNGHHWEVGGGISAHSMVWQNINTLSRLSAFLEANITHFCDAQQVRTFDLLNKPNSRYMLAQRLGPNIEYLAGCLTESYSDPTLSTNQMIVDLNLSGVFAPVANLTKSLVNVSIAAQGDIVLKLAYTNPSGFNCEFGYNFWIRSCEKVTRSEAPAKNPLADGTTWALKGDAIVFGSAPSDIDPTETFHQLAATQHHATIHSGTNGFVAGNLIGTENVLALSNQGIDNPQYAFAAQSIDGTMVDLRNPTTGGPIKTSIQPVFLKDTDVNAQGTKAHSHKLFIHCDYTWSHRKTWNPFLGCGASLEFGTLGSNNASGNNLAISQWGLWIKGGINFDSYNTTLIPVEYPEVQPLLQDY